MKKNKSKKRRPRKPQHVEVPTRILPTAEVITAKHWLPDFKEMWDVEGDLRKRITIAINHLVDDSNVCPDGFTIEEAVSMDPENPNPVKIIGSNWIHADVHGIMTPEIFLYDLAKTVNEFADVIVKEQNPWQPVRIYKDAEPAYNVGFFDWRGDEYAFDLRVVVQFGSWEFTSDKGEKVGSAGFRFWLSTLVLPRKEDQDIHVGQDMDMKV